MSWNLKGSYFETCSCELMCPCNLSFDHGATYDYCRATLIFHIREGEIEGTDVRGRKLAVIVDTPKVMTEGNWRLGMFVDEDATDEQTEKLSAVFGGQMGGPMEGLAPLVGEVLGVERAPIEIVEDGVRHSVRIGDAIDFEVERTSSRSASRLGSRCGSTACSTRLRRTSRWRRKRSKIDAFGIQYEGKSGLSTSEFSWAA